MRGSTAIAGVIIMLVSAGLFAADLVWKELPHEREVIAMQEGEVPGTPVVASSAPSQSGAVASSVMSSTAPSSAASSSRGVVKKGVSTKKKAGIDVAALMNQLQLITQETQETGFLSFVLRDKSSVKTWILLRNNDRAYLFSWIDSPEAKTVFGSLKQALSEQFSGKLTDLIDETRSPAGGPPVDILSFFDPTLSPERIVFLRVRTRLYEIHVAKNGEEALETLVSSLSK